MESHWQNSGGIATFAVAVVSQSLQKQPCRMQHHMSGSRPCSCCDSDAMIAVSLTQQHICTGTTHLGTFSIAPVDDFNVAVTICACQNLDLGSTEQPAKYCGAAGASLSRAGSIQAVLGRDADGGAACSETGRPAGTSNSCSRNPKENLCVRCHDESLSPLQSQL